MKLSADVIKYKESLNKKTGDIYVTRARMDMAVQFSEFLYYDDGVRSVMYRSCTLIEK